MPFSRVGRPIVGFKDDHIRRLGAAQTDIEVFAALEAAGLTYNELGVLVKALPMLNNPPAGRCI